MLVIHENRELNDHIRSVASRLAADGYSALAIDLLSEEGGSETLAQGDVQAALSNASPERLVADMKAGLDELERRAPGARLGAIGFWATPRRSSASTRSSTPGSTPRARRPRPR
jgi:carboxymethylenebutenolidase